MSINAVQIAKELQQQYGHLGGADLLCALVDKVFPERMALVSSFGAEAVVLLHMVSEVKPDLPVIFLDTQKLFPETLAYRDHIIEQFKLTDVRTIYPDYTQLSRYDPEGDLWQKDANACCYIRKVEPLQRALKNMDAWITGRKRYHGGLRTDMPLIEAFEGRVKVNPLATWNRNTIDSYLSVHDLPLHPLREQGFSSIGCVPCTDMPSEDGGARSGRWSGSDKQECGIHMGEDGRFYPSG